METTTEDPTKKRAEARLASAKGRREQILIDLARVDSEVAVLEEILGLTGKSRGRVRSSSAEVVQRLSAIVRVLGVDSPLGPTEIAGKASKIGVEMTKADVADTLRRKAVHFSTQGRGKWCLSASGSELHKRLRAEIATKPA